MKKAKQMYAAIDWFKFYEKFRDNKLHELKKFIGKTQGS